MENNKFYLDNYLDKATKFGYNGKVYNISSREDIKNIFVELSKENPEIVSEFCNAYNGYVLVSESKKGKDAFAEYIKKHDVDITMITESMEASKKMEINKDVFISKEDKAVESFLNEYFPTEEVENVKTYPKNVEETTKTEKKGLFKKIVAVGLATALTVGAVIGCSKYQKNEQPVAQDTNVQEMDFEQLLSLLNEGFQKDSFKNMSDVQNYFNNEAAPSIKVKADKGSQLYLTGDEIVALFTYANADTYATQTFKEIFGNSGLMNSAKLSDDYTQSAKVLNNYYIRAEEKSGLDKLFQGENNQKLFSDFENLVIKYNKNNSNSNKQAIVSKLNQIYTSNKIDNLKTTCPEAASFIGTNMIPALYLNGAISTSQYKTIIEMNETVTCNKLKEYIKEISKECKNDISVEGLSLDNQAVAQMPRAMDQKNIKVASREIKPIVKRYSKSNTIAKAQSSLNVSNPKGQTKIKDGYSEELTKKEAEKEFGKDEVKKAEEKADKTDKIIEIEKKVEVTMPDGTKEEGTKKEYVSIDEANLREEAKAAGISAGYEYTYQTTYYAYETGNKISYSDFTNMVANQINAYTGEYKDSYKEGFVQGAKYGFECGKTDSETTGKNVQRTK